MRAIALVVGLLGMSLACGCASAGPRGWGSDVEPSRPPEEPQEAGSNQGAATGEDAGRAAVDSGAPLAPESGAEPDAGSPAPPPPAGCTYPAGPYGFAQGDTVDPSLSWQGYAPGSSTVSTLKPSDLFDCDGTHGINAVVLDESAIYCATCQGEAQGLEAQMTGSWLAEGVVFVTFISPDSTGSPADTGAAMQWKTTYGLTDVGVYADPNSLVYTTSVSAFPGSYLVDPRTMKVVQVTQGFSGFDPAVDQLAQKNK